MIETERITALLKNEYGVQVGEIAALVSDIDINVRVRGSDGSKYLLKINSPESSKFKAL